MTIQRLLLRPRKSNSERSIMRMFEIDIKTSAEEIIDTEASHEKLKLYLTAKSAIMVAKLPQAVVTASFTLMFNGKVRYSSLIARVGIVTVNTNKIVIHICPGGRKSLAFLGSITYLWLQ